MLEKFVSEPSFLGVIIAAIIGAVISLMTFILSRSFFTQAWGSHVEYSLKNFKEQNQYIRFKVFQLICIYGVIVIVSAILCYILIELSGECLAWGYCLVWLLVFVYFSMKHKIYKIYMDDIIRIQQGKIIKNQLTKLIFSYSFVH